MRYFLFITVIFFISCKPIKNVLYKKFYYFPKIEKEFEVKLPYEIINGFIILKLNVNGKSCRFIFDTGSKSYIKTSLKEELKLNFYCNTVSKDITGHSVNAQVFLGDLESGDFLLNNFRFTTKDDLNMLCSDIDGILGSEILNQGLFYFISSEREIVFTNKKILSNLDDFQKIHIKLFLGNIIIHYLKDKYILDSGYSNGFIRTDFGSSLNDYKTESKIIETLERGLIGSRHIIVNLQNYQFSFGNFNQSGIICFTNDNTKLFGSQFFTMNDVVLDAERNALYIKHNVKSIPLLKEQISNISFKFQVNKVIVSQVSQKNTNIHFLDTVQKINDYEMSNILSNCELMTFLKTIDFKEGLTLEILTEGTVKNIYLSYQDLYQ